MVKWPIWWSWELELSPHLLKRMSDRGFSEAELRLMLEEASGYREDCQSGRWVVEPRHGGRPWEVILDPIMQDKVLVIATAYPLG